MPSGSDQAPVGRGTGEGAGVGIGGRDRLLDKEVLAGLEGRPSIVVVEPRVAEQIDGVDVRLGQGRHAVSAGA